MSAPSLSQLLSDGLRQLGAYARGDWLTLSAQTLMVLARALRVHFFMLPIAAIWVGVAQAADSLLSWRVVVVSVGAGLGWGAGQLLNDLRDESADQVSAASRLRHRGRLPRGVAVVFSSVLGICVAASTALVHRQAYTLVLLASVLIVGYNWAKSWPLLGNLVFGLLLAVASAIGALATSPQRPLMEILRPALPALGFVTMLFAVYVQSNYEKDLSGDRRGGYFTLAHWLGLRGSAVLRGVIWAALSTLAFAFQLVPDGVPVVMFVAATLLGLVAATLVVTVPRESAALAGYRLTVHATLLAAIAVAAPVLSTAALVVVALAASALFENARRTLQNP